MRKDRLDLFIADQKEILIASHKKGDDNLSRFIAFVIDRAEEFGEKNPKESTNKIEIPMTGDRPTITDSMKPIHWGLHSWKEEESYYDEDGDLHTTTAKRVVPWDLCKEIYEKMALTAVQDLKDAG